MLNPVKVSENIKSEFIDYILDTCKFSDVELQKEFKKELNKFISKGPYLEMSPYFKTGKTINDLIKENVLSDLFRELESDKIESYKKILPLDRLLYLHQENAIRKIIKGENVVISTGTGSGKTNCFLIPVINELLKEKEAGTLGIGVRALFIYPMNALLNDQIKNVRKLLMKYPDITFGVYNGTTEEMDDEAESFYKTMYSNEKIKELREPLPNELLSRQKIKETPPNILFTNYSMLEHLLLRPKDDVIFSNADFRFVVLDEAHVYSGSKGIETSFLISRLKARIRYTREPQFILTSATLGNGEDSNNDILEFAQNLCHATFSAVIRAEREEYETSQDSCHYLNDLYVELSDEKNITKDVFNKYDISYDSSRSDQENVYDLISSTDLYERLRRIKNRITSVEDLLDYLQVDEKTAVSFISLCNFAVKNGKQLIDARFHFFLRCLEGCFITISKPYELSLININKSEKGDKFYEIATCNKCGRIALFGKIDERKRIFRHPEPKEVPDYLYIMDDYKDTEEIYDDEEEIEEKKDEKYLLCSCCGAITPKDEAHDLPCKCGKDKYVEVKKARRTKSGKQKCGNCSGEYMRFILGNDAATSVLATALYDELPEVKYSEEDVETSNDELDDFFSSVKNKKKEERLVRQFMCFSDSRQEAAKFACYLGDYYPEILRRRGIYHVIKERNDELKNEPYSVSGFVESVKNMFDSNKTFEDAVERKKNAWMAMLNELVRYDSSTSLTSLGVLQFHYKGNTPEYIQYVSNKYNKYNVSENIVRNLLDLLFFEIVKKGAILTDSGSDIGDKEREYLFYSPNQNSFKKCCLDKEKNKGINQWMPKSRDNNSYYKTNKMYYVNKCLGISDEESVKFLENYFKYLTNENNDYKMEIVEVRVEGVNVNAYVMPAKHIEVLISGNKDAHWYRCEKCGKVSQFNIRGKCSVVNCTGSVEEVSPEEIGKDNHFMKLYKDERLKPLIIKEHTAQLDHKESLEYQEKFIKKEINALSCSTTFEMGVDIGDLETVYMRNVPPLPSNYAQRAGRAGRSIDSVAYALTYAKLSSHDLTYYKEPVKMIGGIISPPLFKVENEKIARRHIYAVALSMYLSNHEDQYNGNNANKFINEKGYEDFIKWIETNPYDLKEMLLKSIPNDGLYKELGLDDFKWIKEFSGDEGVFTKLVRSYESNLEEFDKRIEEFKLIDDSDRESLTKKRKKRYMDNELIDFLARGNILPRYGFPVDTVELEQISTASNVKKLQLSRDLQQAISEYAPSSEIIADGRMYTSRYIKKSRFINKSEDGEYSFNIRYIGECKNCKNTNLSYVPISDDGVECFYCDNIIDKARFKPSIEPRDGFAAEREAKDVPMRKQEKNFRSDYIYIGDKEARRIESYKYIVKGMLPVRIESTVNDSLIVKSEKSFYVCEACGYSIVEDEDTNLVTKKKTRESMYFALSINTEKEHDSYYGDYKCKDKTLKRYSLCHVFKTDCAKITLPLNDGVHNDDEWDMLRSVMYAILYAFTDEFNIERKDVNASLLYDSMAGKFSIIIFDTIPGGAGHSRRLVSNNGDVLNNVFKAAYKRVSECNCDSSCYSCLRSYENRFYHEKLNRKLAEDVLTKLKGEYELKKV